MAAWVKGSDAKPKSCAKSITLEEWSRSRQGGNLASRMSIRADNVQPQAISTPQLSSADTEERLASMEKCMEALVEQQALTLKMMKVQQEQAAETKERDTESGFVEFITFGMCRRRWDDQPGRREVLG